MIPLCINGRLVWQSLYLLQGQVRAFWAPGAAGQQFDAGGFAPWLPACGQRASPGVRRAGHVYDRYVEAPPF